MTVPQNDQFKQIIGNETLEELQRIRNGWLQYGDAFGLELANTVILIGNRFIIDSMCPNVIFSHVDAGAYMLLARRKHTDFNPYLKDFNLQTTLFVLRTDERERQLFQLMDSCFINMVWLNGKLVDSPDRVFIPGRWLDEAGIVIEKAKAWNLKQERTAQESQRQELLKLLRYQESY